MPSPFIRKLESVNRLSNADKQRLEAASRKVQHVPADLDLISEGDTPDHVHLIQMGFACRYKILRDGTRSIMAYLVPGDICDLHVSILGEMDHAIGTLTPCEVVMIPRNEVEDLTANYPAINRALWWSVLVDEAILREWLVNMGRRQANKQIAHLLCELMIRLDLVGLVKGGSFELPMTQEELGDTAGLSTVHVNRVLSELREDGLITLKGKTLTVPDVDRLERFAEFDANYLHLGPRLREGYNAVGNGSAAPTAAA